MKVNSGSRGGMSPPKTTTFLPLENESAAWCQIAWGTCPLAGTFFQFSSNLSALSVNSVNFASPEVQPGRSCRKSNVWSPSQGSWVLSLQPPKTRMHGEFPGQTVQLEWRSLRWGLSDPEANEGSDSVIFFKSRTATCKSILKLHGLQPPTVTTKSFKADAVWPLAPNTFCRSSK